MSEIAPAPTLEVQLGKHTYGGLAPAIMAIVDRGVRARPMLAQGLEAEVELAFVEEYPPVRILFGNGVTLVEDGAAQRPDLRVEGTLADLISLLVAPALGGLPNPMNARGRAVLGLVASRRVRVQGRLRLMRRILAVIRI